MLLKRIDKNDIKCFIGIVVLSGYLAPARRRLFWENATDNASCPSRKCYEKK